MVARNQPMFTCLKEQFKNRTVAKEYLVLAHGRTAKEWDEIFFPIARSETQDRMAARPLSPSVRHAQSNDWGGVVQGEREIKKEKDAHTEFVVAKRFVNFTLLRVKIHTGRMHQIRVHLLAYNHPVVGDPLYNQKKRKRHWDKKCGRLFLHCTKLAFTDLHGNQQTFESPLPKELESFLNTLS